MWKKQLCLGAGCLPQLEIPRQMELFRQTGFDAVFVNWRPDRDIAACARAAKETGMGFQSVHAPFDKMAAVWGDDAEKADGAIDELIACLQDCIASEVPIMVAHAFIGFEDHTPTQIGLERLARLIRAAEGSGTRIAFENTEGLEYLDAIMAAFTDQKTVGFCWDTGHELCYNHGQDMPGRYPGRLIATHLNDNLGIRDAAGAITWLDDLHLLPFDGVADWDDIAARLHREKFDGPLTFELTTTSKPGRSNNDKYAALPPAQYAAEAYARACRLAAKLIKLEEKG